MPSKAEKRNTEKAADVDMGGKGVRFEIGIERRPSASVCMEYTRGSYPEQGRGGGGRRA